MMWVFSVWLVRWSVFWKVGIKLELDETLEWASEWALDWWGSGWEILGSSLVVQLGLTGVWKPQI